MKPGDSKGLSLFSRMLIAFLAVVILVSGALTWAFYVFSKRSIELHASESILQQFKVIEYQFGFESREDVVKNLRILASNPILDEFIMSSVADREIGARVVERLFLGSMRYHKSYEGVYFVDVLGMERVRVDRSGRVRNYRNMSTSRLFTQIKAGTPGGEYLVGPWKDSAGRTVTSIGIHKVDQDIGKFGGALIIDWSLDSFIDHLGGIKIFNENLIWLFSQDGTLLMRPRTTAEILDPRPYLPKDVQREQRLLHVKDGLIVYQDLFVLPGRPLVRLAIGIPTSLLLKDVRATLNYFLLVLLFAVIITFVITYTLSRYLSKPITGLADAASRLAKGDLSTQVAVSASGEVRLLVDSFNKMAGDLKKTTVSKTTLQKILDSMPYGIIIIDNKKKIISVNHSALALMGYEREGQIVGMTCTDTLCLAEEDKCPFLDLKQKLDRSEGILVTKNGKQVPILKSVIPLELDGNNVLLEAVVDITERKRAEEGLKKFAANLEQSNRELQDFTYIASHDLQEPLRKVITFSDRLMVKFGNTLDEQGRDYLERMRNAVARMQTLINDLLMYSKVSIKAQPFEPVDLAVVVKEVLDDLVVRVEQVRGQVHISNLPTIQADPLQMRQLFQNLIGNALKFHAPGKAPVIKITAQQITKQQSTSDSDGQSNTFWEITVQDNGIGFDEKHVDRIFVVFQRLHGQGEYEGSGIGLAICKKIVQRHDGSIIAKSSPGAGAAFIITLPLSTITKEREEHDKSERVDFSSHGRR